MRSRDLLAFHITDLHHDGHWTATVRLHGEAVSVDRSQGSWRITPAEDEPRWRHVLPEVAAELQRCVRREERRAKIRGTDQGLQPVQAA